MNLEGKLTRLRALEPSDIDLMYNWENDTAIWKVSGTTSPFSRHMLEQFIEQQQFDIFQTRQQRLIIETLPEGKPIGTIDLFEFDPVNLRAGVGILIYDRADRGRGHAADAVQVICKYAHDVLHIHQLWCNIAGDNRGCLVLFKKEDFVEIGVKRDWERRVDGYYDEVILQKILE